MDRKLLLQHFGTLAETPDAVVKLRDLVLQLAVRGFLVPQNNQDESGTELLKRILDEKRRLTRESEIKKTPVLEPISSNACPFVIPANWAWSYLNDFGDWGSGSTPNRSNHEFYDGKIPWLKSGELNEGIVSDSEEKVTELALEKCSLRLNKPGDVLLAMYGATVGKVAILGIEATTNQAVCACTCFSGVFNRYLFVLLKAFKQQFISESAGAAQPNFSKDKIIRTVAPLPPPAEQKRIVAKVEELLALCDELEARQTAAREHRTRLVRSALDHLTTAQDESDFKKRSAFCLQNSELLFDSVPALRQGILSLAVQGRLGTQDNKDQPSCGVTDVSNTKLPNKNEPPFNAPISWQWKPLGEMSQLINGDRSKNYPNRVEYVREGVPWINTGHIEPDGTLSLDSMHYITRSKFDSLRSGKIKPGDLVYCLRGATLGKTAIISQFEEGAVASSLVIIRLSPLVDAKYAYCFLTSPVGRQQIWKYDNGSAQPNLSADNVKKYWIPIPQLAEQKRIVAKVDELMRWCDALEARLTAARTAGEHLLDASLRQILAA